VKVEEASVGCCWNYIARSKFCHRRFQTLRLNSSSGGASSVVWGLRWWYRLRNGELTELLQCVRAGPDLSLENLDIHCQRNRGEDHEV
jgi:hypothetical protein